MCRLRERVRYPLLLAIFAFSLSGVRGYAQFPVAPSRNLDQTSVGLGGPVASVPSVPPVPSMDRTPSPAPPREVSPELQGDVLAARGNYAAAINAYEQASPRSAAVWNKLGIAYHHLFALDEATRDYQQALAIDPRYAEALNNLGATYQGRGNLALAEKSYKRALKYEPRNAVVYHNLGTVYFAQDKYAKGARQYSKAVEIDPHIFDADRANLVEQAGSVAQRIAIDYYMVTLYATAGRYEEALDSLRRAIDLGFRDRKRLMADKELTLLRATPGFRRLMVEEQFLP